MQDRESIPLDDADCLLQADFLEILLGGLGLERIDLHRVEASPGPLERNAHVDGAVTGVSPDLDAAFCARGLDQDA